MGKTAKREVDLPREKQIKEYKEKQRTIKKKKWKPISSISCQEPKVPWNVTEKTKLLEALVAHGANDIDKLQHAVETKTKQQIDYFILRRRDTCKRYVDGVLDDDITHNKCSAIENYILRATKELARKCDYSVAIPEAVLKSGETSTSYEEVYRYLHHLLKWEETPQLSPEANSVVDRLLEDLNVIIQSLPLEMLQNLITNGKTVTIDKSEVVTGSYYTSNKLAESIGKSYNPLNISPIILQRVFDVANS